MSEYFDVFINSNISDLEQIIVTDFFGYLAGILAATRLIPQVIKVYKTKSTLDLSFVYLFMAFFTAFFRTIYGVLIGSIPIMVFSPIICLNVVLILCAKFVYDKKNIQKEEINNNESDNKI